MNGCCAFFRNNMSGNRHGISNVKQDEIVNGSGDGLDWDTSFSSGNPSPRAESPFIVEEQPCMTSTPKRSGEECPIMTSTPVRPLYTKNNNTSLIV